MARKYAMVEEMSNKHDTEIYQVFYSAIRKAMQNTKLKNKYEKWRTQNGRKEERV